MGVGHIVGKDRNIIAVPPQTGAQVEKLRHRRSLGQRIKAAIGRIQHRRLLGPGMIGVVGAGIAVIGPHHLALIGQAQRPAPRRGVDMVALLHQTRNGLGENRVRIADRAFHRQAGDGMGGELDVKAVRRGAAQIGHELLAAIADIDQLLDVVPVDVIGAGIDFEGPVEQLVLGADLIAPQAVGIKGRGDGAEPLGGDVAEIGQGRIGAADAIALGGRRIIEVVAIGLIGKTELGRDRGLGGFRIGLDDGVAEEGAGSEA